MKFKELLLIYLPRLTLAVPMVLSLGGTVALAQTNIQVKEFNVSPGQIRLVVNHPLASSTNFTVQASGLTNVWSALPGATVRSLGIGQVELTAPCPTNKFLFFRVFSAVATNIYPFPWNQDSDGDGFSDLNEIAAGTDPHDPKSFPNLTPLPRAEFVDALSQATEGISPHLVNIKFDKPFIGTLKYAVLPSSTATNGVDFSRLSGSIAVAGTNAAIQISWLDDTNISPLRLLFLLITNGPTDLYARGGQTRHTVLLSENDAWWQGVLKDKYAQRNFRVKLMHRPGTSSVIFAAGAGQDGLPVPASEQGNPQSSQSAGVVPVGTWLGTIPFDTSSHFKIVSPPLQLSSGGFSLFGTNAAGLTCTLTLESLPVPSDTNNFHRIIPGAYIGAYTEVLTLGGNSYLGRTNTGTFVLVRDIPAQPNVTQ